MQVDSSNFIGDVTALHYINLSFGSSSLAFVLAGDLPDLTCVVTHQYELLTSDIVFKVLGNYLCMPLTSFTAMQALDRSYLPTA